MWQERRPVKNHGIVEPLTQVPHINNITREMHFTLHSVAISNLHALHCILYHPNADYFLFKLN